MSNTTLIYNGVTFQECQVGVAVVKKHVLIKTKRLLYHRITIRIVAAGELDKPVSKRKV